MSGSGWLSGRRRPKLFKPRVDLRKARPERDRTGEQFAGDHLQLQADLDEPAVLFAAGVDLLLEIVRLRRIFLEDGALLLDKRIAGVADALRKRAGRRDGDDKQRKSDGAPKAEKRHDV